MDNAIDNAILGFHGEYRFLSNFYPCQIEYEGLVFPSTEHSYQAAKSLNKEVRLQIQRLTKPGDAKKVGRHIELRPDWESIKLGLMKQFILQKFSKSERLKKLLLDTGDVYLEESNTWHDNSWGRCVCDNCKDKPFQNLLGSILMEVRNELRS